MHREEATEWRLEVTCPKERVDDALAVIHRVHSYETPAFDVYPLLRTSPLSGSGRIGEFSETLSLAALARHAKTVLKALSVHIVGDANRHVQRVAVACGAAGEFIGDALREGVDALVTGEVRFHESLLAQAQGLGLVLAGHYATERPGVEILAHLIARQFPAARTWPSQCERDPIQLI
jgi:putative NIF3 family GTP cyclohydrolase 1 type 2